MISSNLTAFRGDKEKAKIYLISEGIEDKDIIEMGRLPAKSAQSVINEVLKNYGDEAKVLVLPSASITLPLLEEECNFNQEYSMNGFPS